MVDLLSFAISFATAPTALANCPPFPSVISMLCMAVTKGHFSRTIAKGPNTITWIWNLCADAHAFDSHTSDLEIWRASGIASELQLYCTKMGALLFAALMLFGGWFHYHKAEPKLSWFQDVESMANHHLAGLLGLGSLFWVGHQVHISLLINQFLNTGVDPKEIPLPHEFFLNRDLLAQLHPSFVEEATPFFTLNWSKYADFFTFHRGLDLVIRGLWLIDIAYHHLAIAILFLIAGHMYKTNWGIGHGLKDILEAHKGPFTGQGHKGLYEILTTSWHAQLSLNLAMLGSLTIVVAHYMYSMPPYPYLATDYCTQLSLFTRHIWIDGFLIVGAAAHASIYMLRALSIMQGRAVGVTHYLLGGIATTWAFFLARIIAVYGPCLIPSVADHPLRPATNHCFGHTASFRIRDIHPSHYGRIFPIDTSEGINVGIIGSLEIHARIGHWRSLESPFNEISERSTGVRMLYLSPVSLSRSKKCIVGIVLEQQTTLDLGALAIAEHEGIVSYTNTEMILLVGNGDILSIPLVIYQCSNRKTFMHQKLQVPWGKCIKKGQILAYGAAMVSGELALGKNVLVAYMP
ncbi:Photosystem I chlorophyll a apoprotein A1 [Capsicum annuum]|nr:Photosystem I chlorophyll a apoprotein A1 [Capsicum annuum]